MKRDLLGIKQTSAEDLLAILSHAKEMKQIVLSQRKRIPNLSGRTVVTLFYENSTRTRLSFELASKYMGANAANITASGSSVAKGESLTDTAETIDRMGTDILIMRHSMSGAPNLIAPLVKASVVNAGDGMNEHPTQALLDFYTMREKFGEFKGLKVAILGDIKHSRVAKSNLFGLTKLGAEVSMYAPATLMPQGIERLGAKIASSREEALAGANVVMGLRIQLERMHGGLFPSLSEYNQYYGVNDEHLRLADPDCIVMHPGPVNRGVEFTSDVIDAPNSKITEQVLNGVAVRMALLFLLVKNRQESEKHA